MIACNYVNSVSFHYCTLNFSFNSFHRDAVAAILQPRSRKKQQHRIPHIVTSVLPIMKSYRFKARLKPFILWDFHWTRALRKERPTQQKNEQKNIIENIFPWNLIQRFVSKKYSAKFFFFLFFARSLAVRSVLHLIKIFLNKKCFHFKFFDFFPNNLSLALTHAHANQTHF